MFCVDVMHELIDQMTIRFYIHILFKVCCFDVTRLTNEISLLGHIMVGCADIINVT